MPNQPKRSPEQLDQFTNRLATFRDSLSPEEQQLFGAVLRYARTGAGVSQTQDRDVAGYDDPIAASGKRGMPGDNYVDSDEERNNIQIVLTHSNLTGAPHSSSRLLGP